MLSRGEGAQSGGLGQRVGGSFAPGAVSRGEGGYAGWDDGAGQWYLLLYGSIAQAPLTDWSRVLSAGLCEGGHCNLHQWTQATLSCVRSALDRCL